MQWRLDSFKVFVNTALLVFPLMSWALDDSSLWLPKKYQTLYLPLVRAATAAESIERCVQVLEGTLDLGQSSEGHPIFRILCRQQNGRSYIEMVDGLTFATLTTPKIVEVELTPEQKETLRRQEEAKKQAEEAELKRLYWLQCEATIQQRTRMMQEMLWLSSLPPEPTRFDDQSGEFLVYFDAKNIWGKPLQYEVWCQSNVDSVIDIRVSKRRATSGS